MSDNLRNAAAELIAVLKMSGYRLSTAESCTGGMVSMALCSVENSGEYYNSGFITFSDIAKNRILGVPLKLLSAYTAVSDPVVREMAKGAKRLPDEDIGLAISGYAGPGGGADGTPAGTVWFAWCLADDSIHTSVRHFEGDYEQVIQQATLFALKHLTALLLPGG
ncbi:CinA family protein [Martelella alba]|uniref:CinA family protein n=1 Tax=Martelella alba TaxID=2590451 RepID=A0ABY2SLS7_9HYPH|nr:nicotinamide-nucleotide amidohydrolase family protein [Martelella alba]TKI05978.1 CinA family protein [Martelella alba]